jgi:hypothetical protein
MVIARLVPITLALACCSPSPAQSPEPDACLKLTPENSQATFSGLLTEQIFAGPPNYVSIARGDAEEHAFILELPRRACADDGDFIEASEPFDRVQLSSEDASLIDVLSAAVGRNVTVRGEAFGSHTGHHHAPLVMMVEEVSVR